MEYLDQDQVNRIQHNNDLLSGEFVRRDNQKAIANIRQTALEINRAIKPLKAPVRTLTQVIVQNATGNPIEYYIANNGVTNLVKHRNVHRNIESRIQRLFRRK